MIRRASAASAADSPAPPAAVSYPDRVAAWLRSQLRRVSTETLLLVFGGLVVSCIGLALARNSMAFLLPAVAVLGAGVLLMLTDVRPVWLLLLAVLPLSDNFELPGNITIDLPSEPLMLLLLALVLIKALRGNLGSLAWLRHPVTYVIIAQLLWAGWTAFFSVEPLHSVKYLLAKGWYLASFLIATGLLVRRPADVRLVVWTFMPALLFTIVWSTLRHASRGLTLGSVGWAIQPFYLNHVIYAIVVAQFLPYALFGDSLTGRGRSGAGRALWWAAVALILTGIVLAYTRATWLAVIAAAGYYAVLRLKLVRPVLIAATVSVAFGAAWLVEGQNFLRFKPDFEHTVWNGNDLGKHLSSTVELSDASEMERVYRWVAAVRMSARDPWLGVGPSAFYPEYKKFTDKRFRTYVSDNPEKSTTHNYFLLQLAEQGIPGLALFAALVWLALTLPQDLYHRTRDPHLRAIVLAAGLSLVIIIFHLTLNEVVEVDKIGSFFFIGLTLLIRAGGWIKEADEVGSVT